MDTKTRETLMGQVISTTSGEVVSDVRQLATPDHLRWRRALKETVDVRPGDESPGCVGLAVFADMESALEYNVRVLYQNSNVRFMTLAVAPGRSFYSGHKPQEMRIGAYFEARSCAGAVRLDASYSEVMFDFRLCPYGLAKNGTFRHRPIRQRPVLRAGIDDLALNMGQVQLFRTANRLMEAMIAHGRRYRAGWGADSTRPLRYGDDDEDGELQSHEASLPPTAWMPVPYVDVTDLGPCWADMAVVRQLETPSFKAAFLADVALGLPVYVHDYVRFMGEADPPSGADRWERTHVKWLRLASLGGEPERTIRVPIEVQLERRRGEPVRCEAIGFACERPSNEFSSLPLYSQWRAMSSLGGLASKAHVELQATAWLERQSMQIDGRTLAPFHLVSVLATDPNVRAPLWGWDLAPTGQVFNTAVEAFIPPPIGIKEWYGLRKSLPYEVDCNFLPISMENLVKRVSR